MVLKLKSSANAELFNFKSGWQDSNLRPPRPKRGAITGLRYTPKILRSKLKISLIPSSLNFSIVIKKTQLLLKTGANIIYFLNVKDLFSRKNTFI